MDTNSLYYFAEAAKDMNFTKTAKRLFISQQNLSNHIMRLEAYYDTKLFERKPHLSLTYSGEVLLTYATNFKIDEDNLKNVLTDIKEKERGVLKIGCSPMRTSIVMPQLAVRFAQLLLNFFRADAPVQQFADFLAGFRHIILVALGRVGNNVPHHTAFGQQFAVSGINRAARGGDLGIGKLLFRRLNTVLLSIPDLQGIQLINQNAAPRSDKADHQQQNHDASVQRKRMILSRLRAAAVVMTRGLILVVGLLWHRFIPLQKRLFARIRARP